MKKISFILSGFLFLLVHAEVKAYLILPAPTQTEITTISNNNTNATPYPSIITLSNLPTQISNLTIAVNLTTGDAGTVPLDVILEGPEGQVSYLFSDVGNVVGVTNLIFYIYDDAPIPFPTLPDYNIPLSALYPFYKPTDGNFMVVPGFNPDIFPPPAPLGPYSTNLAVFKDTNPNGDWKLYAVSPFTIIPPFALTINSWQLIINLYPQNDFTGDKISDHILQKRKSIWVVNETNTIPFSSFFGTTPLSVTKTTPPNASVKGKVVAGADFDGDHIGDLVVQKGKTIQVLKGPNFTSPTHALTVKGLRAVASGDYDEDLIPDLYLQKGTSLSVAINTGKGFEAPKVIANKSLPKKFKVFGGLSGRSQPAVVAQSGTTIARLDGPTFSTPVSITTTSSSKAKGSAVGQFIFGLDITGSSIIIQQKSSLSVISPFVSGGITPLQNNELKGLKIVAPR